LSVPNTIFVDSSVLDEQNYNFGSSALAPFVSAAKEHKLTLLLPDPTLREITRHIDERSKEVVKALEDARRRAPFLPKWKNWPLNKTNKYLLSYELGKLAEQEWKDFLALFSVQKLAYDEVNLHEIMNWYDKGRAPFGIGKKRKEFPDAFALASLIGYARKHRQFIAIVSRDGDFEKACGMYSELLHYPTLPAFTEALLGSDTRLAKIKELVNEGSEVLVKAIREEFPELHFYPEEEPTGDVEDVEIEEVTFNELRVVAIGNLEVTVAFEARVNYTAYVQYDDSSSAIIDSSEGIYIPLRKRKGTVADWNEISGSAKIAVNSNWTQLEDITYFNIDDTDIVVTERPEETSYYD
jgi:hypothetical protein